jgi:hypothetical protein
LCLLAQASDDFGRCFVVSMLRLNFGFHMEMNEKPWRSIWNCFVVDGFESTHVEFFFSYDSSHVRLMMIVIWQIIFNVLFFSLFIQSFIFSLISIK